MLFRRINGEVLVGLVHLAVDLTGHYLRLAHGEFEALTAHVLDEDRECEFATAVDFPSVGATGVNNLERHVTDELAVKAILDHAGGEFVTLDLADERRGVRANRHRDRGVIDVDHGKYANVIRISDRLANSDVFDARNCDDVACVGFFSREASECFGEHHLGDAYILHRTVVLHPSDRLALLDRAVVHAQQRDTTEER